MAYSPAQVQKLDDGVDEIAEKCDTLIVAYLEHPYANARALNMSATAFHDAFRC